MSVNETHSQLWVASDPYTEPQLFDPDLGPFETNSFVLSHEYMFVQVSACGEEGRGGGREEGRVTN